MGQLEYRASFCDKNVLKLTVAKVAHICECTELNCTPRVSCTVCEAYLHKCVKNVSKSCISKLPGASL